MNHDQRNHGVFLHRDSGGRHDQSLEQYVEWARKKCEELSITFKGSPAIIREMISSKSSARGDIYLDYEVKGNQLSRPGLNALRDRLRTDRRATHVFIARRDRLGRPDDANLHRTDCPTYLANGWEVGSGAIESACKNVVGERLNGSGMRWHEPGTIQLCHLRALHKSHPSAWRDYWLHRPPQQNSTRQNRQPSCPENYQES